VLDDQATDVGVPAQGEYLNKNKQDCS